MPLPSAGNPIGKPFIELQSIDSTNKYAMGLIHGDLLPDGHGEAQHGMAVFTHEQTAGKGQRGKKWASQKDLNIALSILLNPYPLSIPDQFKLSVCIAVSACEFFSKYAGDETKIKWPNDIYWRDRKAGGILIENVIQSSQSTVGRWQWSVAGIGININQTDFDPNLPNPFSLKQITGKKYNPVELAQELCSIIEKNYQSLIAGNFMTLFNKYQTHLYKKDEKVKLKKGTRVFETTIKEVSVTGQLITQHSIEERFEFGEVEWVL
ncbi:MAG TPA: biotin--[acetyl-CoA-carboxylase] ligase [Chitinophagaceae bacterium]|nr:biotin--[acetyl-CoA-carboxylase] ligase [Chitinophagaceae bacterium]